MTADTRFAGSSALPKGMRIVNYYSTTLDLVHRTAFRFMNDVPAGGQAGFEDEVVFDNREVSCSHVHKGIAVHIDYSGLAQAIGAVELYRQGLRLPGTVKWNLKTKVEEGTGWWNTVVAVEGKVDGVVGAVKIEQHAMRPGYYRALGTRVNGKRVRLARGASLHALLDAVGVDRI